MSRYDLSGTEGEYQPGSDNKVLRNLPAITDPLREGNGRISRLLLDVMAAKAGAQPLDYSLWDEHKAFYFKAIQAGLGGDFQYVERLIRDVLGGQQ